MRSPLTDIAAGPPHAAVIVSRSAITCKMVERPPHPRTLVNSSKRNGELGKCCGCASADSENNVSHMACRRFLKLKVWLSHQTAGAAEGLSVEASDAAATSRRLARTSYSLTFSPRLRRLRRRRGNATLSQEAKVREAGGEGRSGSRGGRCAYRSRLPPAESSRRPRASSSRLHRVLFRRENAVFSQDNRKAHANEHTSRAWPNRRAEIAVLTGAVKSDSVPELTALW